MFLFALLLKLPEFFSDVFLFGRAAGLAGLAFPLGQVVVILLHNDFHLAEGPYKCLLANGIAPKDVQELLGHSDASTTMNVYAHATRVAKCSSARMLDKVVGGE